MGAEKPNHQKLSEFASTPAESVQGQKKATDNRFFT